MSREKEDARFAYCRELRRLPREAFLLARQLRWKSCGSPAWCPLDTICYDEVVAVQQDLDAAFEVTPADRDELRAGRMPKIVRRRLRALRARSPRLFSVAGVVSTKRAWWYAYGDAYHLWCELVVAGHDMTFPIYETLGQRVVQGNACLHGVAAMLPSSTRLLQVVAIDAEPSTELALRVPAVAPPVEPYLINVRAD